MRANRTEKNDPNSIMKFEHEIRSGNSIKMMITIKIRITSKVAIMIKITSKTAQERNYAEFCKICEAQASTRPSKSRFVRNATKIVQPGPAQARPRADSCGMLQNLCSLGQLEPA